MCTKKDKEDIHDKIHIMSMDINNKFLEIDKFRKDLYEIREIHYAELNMIKTIKTLRNIYYGYFDKDGSKIEGLINMNNISKELKDYFLKEIKKFDDVSDEIYKYKKLDDLIKK